MQALTFFIDRREGTYYINIKFIYRNTVYI